MVLNFKSLQKTTCTVFSLIILMIIGVIPGMALLYLDKFDAIMNIKLEKS